MRLPCLNVSQNHLYDPQVLNYFDRKNIHEIHETRKEEGRCFECSLFSSDFTVYLRKENNYRQNQMTSELISNSPEETFEQGKALGKTLQGGELILLTGGLGAGKTLFTKGILEALDFDVDEVTSPSFTLVNLYNAKFDVYHIDLWRLDEVADAMVAVGLDEILEKDDAVIIIEWAEKLKRKDFESKVIRVNIEGDGDEPRRIKVSSPVADG
jgi:tRNA threonylcarbamoyladenosine biosynthesis protein TsaE